MIPAGQDAAVAAERRAMLSFSALLAVLAVGLFLSMGQAQMSPALLHLMSTFVN